MNVPSLTVAFHEHVAAVPLELLAAELLLLAALEVALPELLAAELLLLAPLEVAPPELLAAVLLAAPELDALAC